MDPLLVIYIAILYHSLILIAVFILIRTQRKEILRLKNLHWAEFMTERRKTYDSGWNSGYEFRKSLEDVMLNVALDHISEGDLDMNGKDRITILVARMLEKIERRSEIFNTAMTNSGNDPVVNRVAFLTTMIQIIKDNPAKDAETAEVERHVVRRLIRLRNEATGNLIEKHETVEIGA